jgi:acyl carrier protein
LGLDTVLQGSIAPTTLDDLRDRIRKIMSIALEVEVERLEPNTHIADVDADSMGAIELTMALEDAFDLEIPDYVLDQLTTLQDVTNYLAKRLGI